MKTAYLSLGSNVGDREKMLRSALAALETERLKVVRVSSIYETEPQNLKAQGWFLNLVAEIETSLFPKQLLARVQRVVKLLGMVNATPGFGDHPKVINGCSDLFVAVFGDAGKHARLAVGMGSLPGNISVEIEAIFQIGD